MMNLTICSHTMGFRNTCLDRGQIRHIKLPQGKFKRSLLCTLLRFSGYVHIWHYPECKSPNYETVTFITLLDGVFGKIHFILHYSTIHWICNYHPFHSTATRGYIPVLSRPVRLE